MTFSMQLEITRGIENIMTAIQELIAKVEKLEQFKINLEKPMIGVQHLLMRVEELEEKFTAHCSVFQGGAKTICDLMDRVKELETNPPERTRTEAPKPPADDFAEWYASLKDIDRVSQQLREQDLAGGFTPQPNYRHIAAAVLDERERCANRVEAAGGVYEESLYERGWNAACNELASVLRSGE